jgi:hypothetical protein
MEISFFLLLVMALTVNKIRRISAPKKGEIVLFGKRPKLWEMILKIKVAVSGLNQYLTLARNRNKDWISFGRICRGTVINC